MVCEQRVIERVEVGKALAKIKCGIATGIDGIIPQKGETWRKCSGRVDGDGM